MIVRCPNCRSQYEITTRRSLDTKVKVRCPRCKAVFPVEAEERDGATASAASRSAAAAVRASPPGAQRNPVPGKEAESRVRATPGPPRSSSRLLVTDPALARRLARAMISEILLNRRQERDEALAANTVLSRFGTSIVSAYAVYGSKVSPVLRTAPRIFREAVNEILGGGRPIL